jgi:hypothetical protein
LWMWPTSRSSQHLPPKYACYAVSALSKKSVHSDSTWSSLPWGQSYFWAIEGPAGSLGTCYGHWFQWCSQQSLSN